MLDFAILGLLREQPRHGYELKRALGELEDAFDVGAVERRG